MQTELFHYRFSAGGALDIGALRKSNQDRIIRCDELGFFAVSDGMGGLAQGGKTSEIISEVLPSMVEEIAFAHRGRKADPRRLGMELAGRVQIISDNIFDIVNTENIDFGATLSCVWLVGNSAVFVNLGDSRGYVLPRYKRELVQITDDHNIACELVRLGELSKEEGMRHPASSRLTQFMGMPAPAQPDVYIVPVFKGDRILLCSDGLSGEISDDEIRIVMRSSRSPNAIGRKLVDAANQAGGHDNISTVYIKIDGEKTI